MTTLGGGPLGAGMEEIYQITAALKHLVALREAGLITMNPTPADGHRNEYLLSVGIPVTRTEKGLEMDFDCCVVRVRQ